MDSLRTEIENIENDLERAYVIERSQVQTDKDGYTKAGMAKTTFYTWPTERRDYLNTLARRLNTEVAIQIIMELQDVGREAAIVKADGLRSRNEQIKQRAATEIIEWLIGKATQKTEEKTVGEHKIIFEVIRDEIRYKISTQAPHEKQVAFIKSPAKRKVIVAGRRGGKTTGVAILAADMFMKGRRILEAAPTQDQTERFWEVVKDYFEEPIDAGFIYKNETKRLLELPNGGRLRTKTAWDADSLRGDYADLLILDEFADMDVDAWDKVGAPMLLDNDGDAIFIGTPKRRNHFFRMYQQAIGDDTGRWGAWYFTSYDNPHLSKQALDEITKDMTQSAYKQEIMAEFLEGEGQVFRNINACMGAELHPKVEKHQGHRIVAGVDWAKQHDYTAISVGCADCRQELVKDRFNKIDYHFQRRRIEALVNKYNINTLLVELNSIGEPNFEEMQRSGLPVSGFTTTAASKPPLIENLALALEKQEWQFQSDSVWTGELEAYEMKTSSNTGRPSYSAPEGMHDDTVIARALMLRAATTGRIEVVENPFYK